MATAENIQDPSTRRIHPLHSEQGHEKVRSGDARDNDEVLQEPSTGIGEEDFDETEIKELEEEFRNIKEKSNDTILEADNQAKT